MKRLQGAWECLLKLNGGLSAEWITGLPGKDHQVYMCCLVLTTAPEQSLDTLKPRRRKRLLECCAEELWLRYYAQIAIVVPLAVQSGIAMAQGIKRLEKTCPCREYSGLGMLLLASLAEYFETEYLFLSPIEPFASHVRRQLHARRVPYGSLGFNSLWWALRETQDKPEFDEGRMPDPSQWLDVRDVYVFDDAHKKKEAVALTIAPQPPFRCATPPERRVLLINACSFAPMPEQDPDYRPPRPLRHHETFDFLARIAGDGVLVVHGPSLADAFLNACPQQSAHT